MITITDQGLSYVQYEADGIEDNFVLTFPYLKQADLIVYIDGVPTGDFTWLNPSEITMDDVPASGALITLLRSTEQDERLVDFQDGGVLKEATLDLDSNQLFYLAQEAIDSTSRALAIDSTTSIIDAKNNRIINLADGEDPQDAVSFAQLTLVDDNADAALTASAAAVSTANTALATANAISGTAATALSTANTALSTANTALSTANNALSVANGISDTADTALDNSATAISTANSALSTIEAHELLTEVHGATGAVVGTTNIQTLTNKTFISPVINTPTGITKSDVGLGNVDNTSDATKDAATATLTNKTLTSPVINSPTGLVKADVGLSNVDNTSDATKNSASVTLTNKTLTSPVINSPTGLVKADVGLGNVDNTSDATKNAASVTLTNKTMTSPVLNSPSIVTPSRSDIKQDTAANLATYASTASEGQLCWSTDTKILYKVVSSALVDVRSGAAASLQIATIQDQKSSGTSGGSASSGYQVRTLNTLADPSGIVTSLSSNQFTLPAGTYFIEWSAPMFSAVAGEIGVHRTKLRNATDSTDVAFGSSEQNSRITTSSVAQTRSFGGTHVTIASSKAFEIQHYTANAGASGVSLGAAVTSGNIEVYTMVKITKVA